MLSGTSNEDPDSLIVFPMVNFDIDSLRLKDEMQGEEAIEFSGVREACPESGSIVGAG